ncbi:hypothetical protein [Rhizobium sp. 42MFCr.1]|uniref:hypothetical protein n=1 Tax=Rhizobium sp. 42MFCr.1 TaxID=1048680 RepID=UPI0012EBF2D3|nr:hypothetical protein [Rhizobium sp. 42MFCr.1]
MTIDPHDEDKPTFSLRMAELDGEMHYLAKDICSLYDLRVDDDGDYRSVLSQFEIPFRELMVDSQGGLIGPVALMTETAHKQLVAEVLKLHSTV